MSNKVLCAFLIMHGAAKDKVFKRIILDYKAFNFFKSLPGCSEVAELYKVYFGLGRDISIEDRIALHYPRKEKAVKTYDFVNLNPMKKFIRENYTQEEYKLSTTPLKYASHFPPLNLNLS